MDDRSEQAGDMTHAAPPDYGFALPLTGPEQTDLEAIPIDAKRFWNSDTEKDFLFLKAGVFLHVTTTYRLASADSERAFLAATTLLKRRDDLTKVNASDYPGLTSLRPLQ